MKRQIIFALLIFIISSLSAQNIILPQPVKTGGMALMDALSRRSTARVFDTTSLSVQQVSDLLWAAFGINRPDGRRTAPSARNFQETEIYVLMKKGVYTYDAKNNQLLLVLNRDMRNLGGTQDFVKNAPLTFIFITDLSKMGDENNEEKLNTGNIDVGYISQNIYLYCASAGLVTGARGSLDRTALTVVLSLRVDQKIILGQSVGFPVNENK